MKILLIGGIVAGTLFNTSGGCAAENDLPEMKYVLTHMVEKKDNEKAELRPENSERKSNFQKMKDRYDDYVQGSQISTK